MRVLRSFAQTKPTFCGFFDMRVWEQSDATVTEAVVENHHGRAKSTERHPTVSEVLGDQFIGSGFFSMTCAGIFPIGRLAQALHEW